MNQPTSIELQIRIAASGDAAEALDVLREIAAWLEAKGRPLWEARELTRASINAAALAGELIVGRAGEQIAAVMLVQNADPVFWPDYTASDSCFLHKLGVRRAFAGRGYAKQMIAAAERITRDRGRQFLRLDCDPRPELVGLYTGLGFTKVDEGEWDGFRAFRFEKCVAT